MSTKKSGRGKHSYIPFYMDDWYGGTARMTRLIKSVYFDICLYTWDKAKPVPQAELMLMLADLEAQGTQIVDVLVAAEKLVRNADGSVHCARALHEAQKAFSLWDAKSGGGKRGANATNAGKTGVTTPAKTPVESRPQNHTHTHIPTEEGANAPLSENEKPKNDEAEGKDEGEGKRPVIRKAPIDPAPVAQAWNEMAASNGLAQIKKMTEERIKKMRARIDEYGVEDMVQAIRLIPDRPFCMGENDRRWKVDIDFLLRPGTVAKLIEGTAYTGAGGKGGWLDA